MKKIKFGSFPLIEVDARDRECFDKYSIKSFADLLTMNTHMKSTSSDTQQYITPDVILKYFNTGGITELPNNRHDPKIKTKMMTMRRAFRSLQTFNKMLEGNPFYQKHIAYPIYLEHENKNNSHDYDFILLSNDLIPSEILDEIKYDDTTTLTFLFIKDMLYPTIPLSEIGSDQNSYTIRSDIAKFIEFSKNNNTDPITAMLKLVKIAGIKKQKQGSGYTGLTNLIRGKYSAKKNSIADKFFKLFGGDRHTGQIKDVNFLLNEISQLDIAEFFDDTSTGSGPGKRHIAPNNLNAHTGYSNGTRTDDIPSRISRQYIAQKTQDYNKILSIVDSLINFNASNEVFADVDGKVKDGTIKLLDKNKEMTETDVNYDKIIDSLRNDYFESFLINIIQKLNVLQKSYYSNVTGKKHRLKKKSDIYNIGENNTQSINSVNLEIAELTRMINEVMNGGGDPSQMQNYRDQRNALNNRLDKLNLNAMFISTESREQELKTLKDEHFKSSLVYNVENIQGELTGILNDIEGSLYDQNKLQNIFNVIGNKSNFQKVDLLNLFDSENMLNYNVEQLSIAITEGLRDTIISEMIAIIDNSSTEYDLNERFDQDSVIKYFKDNNKKIESVVTSIIHDQLYLLFKRLGRDFGDKTLFDTKKYADLRTSRNPIIRKTITNSNNFKTYILSQDVIANLYDMLNYIDTQKYIAGLIAYPPTKINNAFNIMKYIIKRLGLDNNPIFIVGKGKVILSQPDFLSLTGNSIFTEINQSDMENLCRIDYNKELYDNNRMFKKANETIKSNTQKDFTKLFAAMTLAAKSVEKDHTKVVEEIKTLTGIIKSSKDKAEVAEAKIKKALAIKRQEKIKTDHDKIRSRQAKEIDKFKTIDYKDESVPYNQDLNTSTYKEKAHSVSNKGKADNYQVIKNIDKSKNHNHNHNQSNYKPNHNKYKPKK